MKRVLLVLAGLAWGGHVAAAGPSCMAQAEEKKLAGAAKTSFMKKCETDAKAACEASAQDKKLAGAAKTSFMKKCADEAIGSK